MTGTLNLVGYGLAAIGPGLAVGMIFAAYINGGGGETFRESFGGGSCEL